jgi:hypothetical protein
MSRWATAAVALLLVPVLSASALASCLAAPAVAPQAQMACCHAGHEECPHSAGPQSAADCCQRDAQRQQELTAAELQPDQASWVSLERIVAVTPHAALPFAPDATIAAPYSDLAASPPPPRTSLSTVLLI